VPGSSPILATGIIPAQPRPHPVPMPTAPRLTDAELVAAIRREEPAAIAELFRRFAPMLRRSVAAWPAVDGEVLVEEVIEDVALTLMRPTTPAPRSLAAYLLVALRHRVAAVQRAESDRAMREGEVVHDTPTAAGGSPAPHPVLALMATRLDATLSDQERLLLAWMAEHVPMRTVATWLGIGYDAALKRASRLRTRLRADALAYVATLPPEERRVVELFLERATDDHESSTSMKRTETGS